MPDPIAFLDALASPLPPLLRISIWATISGILSMAIYAWFSPQAAIIGIKLQQKDVRKTLKQYDGEWDGMWHLIGQDLSLSWRQVRLIFFPFVISTLPLIALIYSLYNIYGEGTYLNFGPSWMQGFEFSYIFVLLVASIIVKIVFKIA